MKKLAMALAALAFSSPVFAEPRPCDAVCIQHQLDQIQHKLDNAAEDAAHDAAECAERQAKGKPCPIR